MSVAEAIPLQSLRSRLGSFRSESLAPLRSCHGLSRAYGWSEFQCDSAVALVAGQLEAGPSTSVPRGTQSSYQKELHLHPTPQLIPLSPPGKGSLKELGLSCNLRVSERFTRCFGRGYF